MRLPHRPLLLLAALTIGCAHSRTSVDPVGGLPAVAVFPPNNRTGDPLPVSGASAIEKYVLRSDQVTVPDVLAAEARAQLAMRGYKVTPPETVEAAAGGAAPRDAQEARPMALHAGITAAVMYIELRRWLPDAPMHPAYILADVDVSLIDPATGNILWTARHSTRPVPTPGVVIIGDAHLSAVHRLMGELLAPLRRN